MPIMPVNDAVFLLSEQRERPMHVGGLQIFSPPEGASRGYMRELHRSSVEIDLSTVHPLFRRRAHRSIATFGQWAWEEDAHIDLEYHVRHSALPRPGRVRELLALTSRLHGTLLDRSRPLWEIYLIEGLKGGRFAVYSKMHHAMVDGVAALRILQDALSDDPDRTDLPPPWAMPRRKRRATGPGVPLSPASLLSGAARAAGEAVGVGRVLIESMREGFGDSATALPFQAPRTMLNVPITGARRFAADSWDLSRIQGVRAATGATLNDVVLAMSSGALRAYLLEQGELPDAPLTAMVPMALRSSDEASGGGGGNAVASILCSLATDVNDPAERLARIIASMRAGKERFAGLSAAQAMAISATVMAGLVAGPLTGRGARPPFNLVISNVPGPRRPLWWNGARLEGVYPLSIPMDGQAFNITVTSYVDHLEFGLVGCRQSVPHLQRMLTHLEESLAALEEAVA